MTWHDTPPTLLMVPIWEYRRLWRHICLFIVILHPETSYSHTRTPTDLWQTLPNVTPGHQHHDLILPMVTLSWYWANQSLLLSTRLGSYTYHISELLAWLDQDSIPDLPNGKRAFLPIHALTLQIRWSMIIHTWQAARWILSDLSRPQAAWSHSRVSWRHVVVVEVEGCLVSISSKGSCDLFGVGHGVLIYTLNHSSYLKGRDVTASNGNTLPPKSCVAFPQDVL